MEEVNISKLQKVGTCFKKENIFLGTLLQVKEDAEKILKGKLENSIPEEILALLIKNCSITSEQFDIFYKDENGYTRFVAEGPETFVGDNSDGKGIVTNLVPIWDYYSEDEVTEIMVNDSFMAISVTAFKPIWEYNRKYNLKKREDI